MNLKQSLFVLVALGSLTAAIPARAEGKHEHGVDGGHAEDKAHFEKPTFANVKDAWTFVIAKVGEAETHLANKKLDPVHEIGEQLEGAVHTLEEKSDMVTGDAKPKLASVLTQLDKAADGLHHATEANDAAGAALSLKKIKGLLPLVEGLYPPGILK